MSCHITSPLREFHPKIISFHTVLFLNGGSTAEQLWIFLFHLIIAFPSKLRPSTRVSSYFYYRYATLFKAFDFLIYGLHGFLHEVKFSVDLDLIERNNKVLIRETLLEIIHLEGIVNFSMFFR